MIVRETAMLRDRLFSAADGGSDPHWEPAKTIRAFFCIVGLLREPAQKTLEPDDSFGPGSSHFLALDNFFLSRWRFSADI